MTIPKHDVREVFDRAIEHTRRLSPATFDQWFGGVQFDDLTDGVLSLRVQNEFVLEWVRDNFLPTLTEKIRELTGWSVQVAWTLDPALVTPIAQRSEVAPVRPRPIALRPVPTPVPASGPPSPRLEVVRRPPPPDEMNPKHTFANFVVGPSNQLAHAAAIAAAGGGGRRYNPLFICGGTGLGKTHLVHAIAHRVYEERPEARIIYVSAERFTNDFITAIQHHRMDDFRTKYRQSCDLLLVDDIQFLAGREQTQEEFFHTFNALHALDRQIVVTSDKYPQNLERMEERLVSRFSWGLVADIQVPELETRVAIVRNKAAQEGIVLSDDVALYLGQMIRSNVRELEGTLIRLAAKSSLTGRPVDLAFARAEITATSPPRAQTISVEDIQRAVCHHFHLRSTDLTSKDRHKSVAFARHVAMYLCKQRLKCSFPEIGRAFGNRDHTTVMSAVRKIEAQRDSDPQVRAHLEALEKKLAADE
ncbi:chromosomal replication initiator protein DnaA [Chondromyces crocatus]|uniref:Chromosomal replication initiator protein DnaA n=1 Tax=Chondromyces crocatus TaxID=52 RepID=A0A0K1E4T1_CHOCO|nr:chromosomal replication initiator protein DnaA [Chondromyces crocatus]AKT35890.1 chromosomal replication initiator protein DnaA [Chondromyces crocatus]